MWASLVLVCNNHPPPRPPKPYYHTELSECGSSLLEVLSWGETPQTPRLASLGRVQQSKDRSTLDDMGHLGGGSFRGGGGNPPDPPGSLRSDVFSNQWRITVSYVKLQRWTGKLDRFGKWTVTQFWLVI